MTKISLLNLQYELIREMTGSRVQTPSKIVSRSSGLEFISGSKNEKNFRFNRYKNASFSKLQNQLYFIFETVFELIDKSKRKKLVREFEKFHPSRSIILTDLGSAFILFVKSHPYFKSYPFVQDLARLEWSVVQSLSRPLKTKKVKKSSIDNQFNASTRFILMSWTVFSIWKNRLEFSKKRLKKIRQTCQILALIPSNEGVLVHKVSLTELSFLLNQYPKKIPRNIKEAYASQLEVLSVNDHSKIVKALRKAQLIF